MVYSNELKRKVYLIEFKFPDDYTIHILIKSAHRINPIADVCYNIQQEFYEVFDDLDDCEEWLIEKLKEHLDDVEVIDYSLIIADESWKYDYHEPDIYEVT